MIRSCAGLILAIVGAGCAASKPPPPHSGPLEISRDPTILYREMGSWSQMSLNGVRLGDPETVIPAGKIRSRTASGWILSRDNCRYRVTTAKITGLGVWDEELLEKLQVHAPADVTRLFGEPESTEEFQKEVIYYYASGHVHVVWNIFEKRLNTVNVLE